MDNISIKLTKKDIIIRVRIQDIVTECKNGEWTESKSIGPIKDRDAMAEWLKTELDEPSVDVGNGYVSPVANMIMDVLSEGFSNAADFFEDEFDDEDE